MSNLNNSSTHTSPCLFSPQVKLDTPILTPDLVNLSNLTQTPVYQLNDAQLVPTRFFPHTVPLNWCPLNRQPLNSTALKWLASTVQSRSTSTQVEHTRQFPLIIRTLVLFYCPIVLFLVKYHYVSHNDAFLLLIVHLIFEFPALLTNR